MSERSYRSGTHLLRRAPVVTGLRIPDIVEEEGPTASYTGHSGSQQFTGRSGVPNMPSRMDTRRSTFSRRSYLTAAPSGMLRPPSNMSLRSNDDNAVPSLGGGSAGQLEDGQEAIAQKLLFSVARDVLHGYVTDLYRDRVRRETQRCLHARSSGLEDAPSILLGNRLANMVRSIVEVEVRAAIRRNAVRIVRERRRVAVQTAPDALLLDIALRPLVRAGAGMAIAESVMGDLLAAVETPSHAPTPTTPTLPPSPESPEPSRVGSRPDTGTWSSSTDDDDDDESEEEVTTVKTRGRWRNPMRWIGGRRR